MSRLHNQLKPEKIEQRKLASIICRLTGEHEYPETSTYYIWKEFYKKVKCLRCRKTNLQSYYFNHSQKGWVFDPLVHTR